MDRTVPWGGRGFKGLMAAGPWWLRLCLHMTSCLVSGVSSTGTERWLGGVGSDVHRLQRIPKWCLLTLVST